VSRVEVFLRRLERMPAADGLPPSLAAVRAVEAIRSDGEDARYRFTVAAAVGGVPEAGR
jgi:hypothetical protein